MKTTLSRLLLCAAMLTFLGDDCSGLAVENGSFRGWQDDGKPGAWEVTTGSIRKASTWDDSDPAVELVDTPTEIVQKVSGTATCGRVTIMGKIDASAGVTVSTTTGAKIPALDWESYTVYLNFSGTPIDSGATTIVGPQERAGNTLKIRKTGEGTAIIAIVTVASASGCGPSTAIP